MSEALLNPTRKRLDELEKELRELREKRDGLKAHWHLEKSNIQTIRKLTSDIEDAKVQAAEFERQGNFAKVAEIRYGTILEYKKQLDAAHLALSEVQSSGKMLKEEVDAEDIAEIVAKWTGIPVQRMVESERTKLLHMEDRLHQRVVAQADAVHAISNALRRSRAGLQDANRPIGSFIFLGTTGVGKTEMARAVAEFLFDDENAIVRIDMSEYMEKFSVSRLIGAPPGYVGYEEGGQLTEAVRRKQYSVVLLDEIEKAHPEVFNILLQVLDDGRLTDGKGREVNFRNTIIIMTSNLGTEYIQDKILEMTDENRDELLGSVRSQIVALLRQKMRPEFLNRIDEIILFKPLTQSEIRQIARVQLDKLAAKLHVEGIEINVSDDALDWIARIGYDVQFGARPLRRAIQKYVADPLAMKLLGGEFISGDSIRMDVGNTGSLTFEKV
ncbi:MAG: AAA family ATPase [Ignavibacteria bacterium]|nr:AAA family ATPase [Ignavibacteria bacterium]